MDVNFYRAPASTLESAGAPLQRGFTLLELLITLSVVSALLVVAVPSFAELVADTRLVAAVNNMTATLQLARSEAIKRTKDVVICQGEPGLGCDSSRNWQQGWIVFVDANADRQWNSATETLVWTQRTLPPGDTVTLHAFPSANYFTYHPSGLAGSNGTFVFCDERGSDAAHALIIARTGRPRASRTAADGSSLNCPAGA